jgi:hypothetical protein
MEPGDQEVVRAFRRQAQDVRKALAVLREAAPGRRMVNGYIEVERWLDRYRSLCVPVRRAFLDHDKASFRRSAAILCGLENPDLRSRAEAAGRQDQELSAQLDREAVLGGRRIKGREMVRAWLDAAVFYDSTDRQKPYDEMVATLGKAVEGLAAEYTEDLARAVLALDEVAAVALEEPLTRPEPESSKTPPPASQNWWHRLLHRS